MASRSTLTALVLGLTALRVPAQSGTGDIIFNEILADPPVGLTQWIELRNLSPRPIQLAGCHLRGAADVRLAPDLELPPLGFAVLAAEPELFTAIHGRPPNGRLPGGLPRNEGKIELVDPQGRPLAAAAYRVEEASLAAHGGASLELPESLSDARWTGSWRPSRKRGGTPGERNSLDVLAESQALVPGASEWRYWKGRTAPAGGELDWTLPGFDDASWETGIVPVGFGSVEASTLLEDMRGSYTTVYLRHSFHVQAGGALAEAILSVHHDDGFVAYLNGVEVARRNLGAAGWVPPPGAVATARQENEGTPEVVHIASFSSLLRPGENVLAVLAANDHVRGSDFVINPVLGAFEIQRASDPPPEIRLNEVWIEAGEPRVELWSLAESPVELGGAALWLADGTGEEKLPPGTVIPAGGFLVFPAPAGVFGGRLVLELSDGTLLDAIDFLPTPSGQSAGRFPDGRGAVELLPEPTPGAPNRAPVAGPLVFTEVHYNPPDPEGELVEVLARQDLDLTGWALAGGVRFDFPAGTRVRAGERLVVARDPSLLRASGAAGRILGPLRGRLANDGELLILLDSSGRPVDRLRYADDGEWPQEADGSGASLELVAPDFLNDAGGAWRASRIPGGTPGLINSVEEAAPPPVIARVELLPMEPRPGEPVLVRAFVDPPRAEVWALVRLDGENDFQRVPLSLEGAWFEGTLPPREEGALLEVAIEAEIPGSPGALRAHFPATPPGTVLYQVDRRTASSIVPLHRLLIRRSDLAEMFQDPSANTVRPATLIAEGRERHQARVRLRGNGSRHFNPHSFRVAFPEEERLQGDRIILFNAFEPARQILGMDVWRRSGLPYSRARAVQLLVNESFEPRYAQVEPIDEEYLLRHFGDETGNLYRGLRTADLSYLGEGGAAYEAIYEKHTNEEERDWSDIIEVTRAFSETSDEEFPRRISLLVDVEEWIRALAIHAVLSNQEGGIHRDTGDDYFIYRPSGGRFVLLPWDMDSTFLLPEEHLFRPTLPAIRRLITHPDLAPRFHQEVEWALATYFSSSVITRQTGLLSRTFPSDLIDELGTFARDRGAFLRRSVPAVLTVGLVADGWGTGALLHVTGPSPVLGGESPPGATRSVRVGGSTASFDPVQGQWSLPVPWAGRDRSFLVEALDRGGELLESHRVTLRRLDDEASRRVTSLPAAATDWSSSGSPYLLDSEVLLPGGGSLTLGPGTEVLCRPGAKLHVEGQIRLLGEAGQPVRISAADAGRPWRGIELQPGASGEIRHTIFGGGGTAGSPGQMGSPFLSTHGGRLVVSSSTFLGIPQRVLDALEGELEVRDCNFIETGEAIHGERSSVVAVGNWILGPRGNSDGIDLDGEAAGRGPASTLAFNLILGAEDDGIDLFEASPLLEGNFILDAKDRGFSLEGRSSPRVVGNLVVGCVTGLALKDGVEATGSRNTIVECEVGLRAFIKNPGPIGGSAELFDCIIRGNQRDLVLDGASHLALDHSNLGEEPGRWGAGNFDEDPRFAGDGTYRLRPGSPCLGSARDGGVVGARDELPQTPPHIDSVAPAHGPLEGGIVISLQGAGLEGARTVTVSGRLLLSAHWVPSGRLVGLLPPGLRGGPAALAVTTDLGDTVSPERFRYDLSTLRGDFDSNRRLDVGDVVALLLHLFASASPAPCPAAADWNGDAVVGIEDALDLLGYLFRNQPAPASQLAPCDGGFP